MVQSMELQAGGKRGGAGRFVRFFGELKEEVRRIQWTTKEELKSHTKIVVAAVFLVGISVYGIDLVCQYTVWGIARLFGVASLV
jgi:preprotein translocase subunit SecE